MSVDVTEKLAAERRQMAQLVRDTEHELRTNADYQPYFAGYTPASVAAFISAYAQRKARYVLNGPSYVQSRERRAAEFHTEAYERLWEIQQKKLFDIQCRWRAKEIDLPGVTIYQQFEEWADHPERCPFLPPITPDEVEVYRAYLLSPDCVDAGDYYSYLRPDNWQNYADMHLTGDEEEPDRDDFYRDDEASINNDFPGNLPWYAYYDDHHDQDLLALPDLRGERQKYYATLHIKHCHAQQAAEKAAKAAAAAGTAPAPEVVKPTFTPADLANAPDPIPDRDRRTMWGHYNQDSLFETIATRFDPTPRLLQLKEAMDAGIYHRDDTNDAVNHAFDVLIEAQVLVPLEAAADWREALVAAALALRKQWLSEALTDVYEQYQQRLALGLEPATPAPREGWSHEEYEEHFLQIQRDWVLAGRALCGEPQDFNY